MFGILEGLAKAVVSTVVELPVAVVADVVTLGGVITDKNQPYTVTACSNIVRNIGKAVE